MTEGQSVPAAVHWALEALGADRIAEALRLAKAQVVHVNLGSSMSTEGLSPEQRQLVADAAFAHEIAAMESITEFSELAVDDPRAKEYASTAFSLMRVAHITESTAEDSTRHMLVLAGLAYVADRWPEFRSWLKSSEERLVPYDDGSAWDTQILAAISDCWMRLLRKDGWADLSAVALRISELRERQAAEEASYLSRDDGFSAPSPHSAAWRLVGLYHWARITEIVASYMTQGEPNDAVAQIDLHTERAITAAMSAGDPAFVVVLRWQRVLARRMIANSVWHLAKAAPAMRDYVDRTVRQRGMVEMLPPQRAALLEQGILDPASMAVVIDLPTSAGKTTLAEIRVLQALNQYREDRGWVAYVAPTRALVAQITRRLRKSLGKDINVEPLSGAIDIDQIERGILEDRGVDVFVLTPEKLNLMVRNEAIDRPLSLVIVDEAHNLESASRGMRIELLLATVKRDCASASFLLMMPNVPNSAELARWLDPSAGKSVSLSSGPWQPNDRLIGALKVEAPEGGRGREWGLVFDSLVTTSTSLGDVGTWSIGSGPQFSETFSKVKSNLGLIAGAAGIGFASRGTSIVFGATIPSVWNVARLVADTLGDAETHPEVSMVQRFLAAEVSPDFELIQMLNARVAVHHAGLSDEARSLVEWLAEQGHLRVVVATSGLAQGLNFPVSSIFLASRYIYDEGQSREMSSRDFWNLAGRAGRVDQASVGVIGLAEQSDRAGEVAAFLSRAIGNLESQIVTMLAEIRETGSMLELSKIIYGDQWADFRSYVAHLLHQKRELDAVLAETELLLRSTFGYTALESSSQESREAAQQLLAATRAYATELSKRAGVAALADSTGFTPEGVNAAMAAMRDVVPEMSAQDWSASSLFGGGAETQLPGLMRVMLSIPQINDQIRELAGSGPGLGERAAEIASAWVGGWSLSDIAATYFADGNDATGALTAATKAIYRNLVNAGTWGIAGLAHLPTSGIDSESLSDEQRQEIDLLGAMLYHGVRSEAAVRMRMQSVPRSVAEAMGAVFESEVPASDRSVGSTKAFIASRSADQWASCLKPEAPVTGSDLSQIWRVLSGAQ